MGKANLLGDKSWPCHPYGLFAVEPVWLCSAEGEAWMWEIAPVWHRCSPLLASPLSSSAQWAGRARLGSHSIATRERFFLRPTRLPSVHPGKSRQALGAGWAPHCRRQANEMGSPSTPFLSQRRCNWMSAAAAMQHVDAHY